MKNQVYSGDTLWKVSFFRDIRNGNDFDFIVCGPRKE